MLSFIKLCQGCGKLLDLGSSAGIFSAIFTASRKQSEIVGVEPDRISFDLFAETMEANGKSNSSWRRERVVIGDAPGEVRFANGAFGGNVVGQARADCEVLPMETIAGLCERINFNPDIIKIDIESFEYEALTGSLAWLQQKRPRLFLELHWQFLVDRNVDPAAFLRLLEEAGLRLSNGQGLSKIGPRHLDAGGITHLALDWAAK